MKRVSVSKAKNGLCGLLGEVRRGETVLITHRGEPVARIEPCSVDSSDAEDATAELLGRGIAVPPRASLDVERFLAVPVPRLTGGLGQRDHRGRARGERLKYWDSSALVVLLVEEPQGAERRATIRRDPVGMTWWGSRIECALALNRLERERRFESGGLGRAMDQLGILAASWLEIEPLEQVRRRAMRLLRLHPLRADPRGRGPSGVPPTSAAAFRILHYG